MARWQSFCATTNCQPGPSIAGSIVLSIPWLTSTRLQSRACCRERARMLAVACISRTYHADHGLDQSLSQESQLCRKLCRHPWSNLHIWAEFDKVFDKVFDKGI